MAIVCGAACSSQAHAFFSHITCLQMHEFVHMYIMCMQVCPHHMQVVHKQRQFVHFYNQCIHMCMQFCSGVHAICSHVPTVYSQANAICSQTYFVGSQAHAVYSDVGCSHGHETYSQVP